MKIILGFVLVVTVATVSVPSVGFAAVTEAQVRAGCAKAADNNGVNQARRQKFIEMCVTKKMANQKK